MEMKEHSFLMKLFFRMTEKTIAKSFGGKVDYSNPTFKMVVMSGADAPFRSTVLAGGGAFPANLAEGLIAMANGHPLRGLRKMIGKQRKGGKKP